MQSILTLLNNCQKLTHLSLTGVQAFLREDLEQFCRAAPAGKFNALFLQDSTNITRIY